MKLMKVTSCGRSNFRCLAIIHKQAASIVLKLLQNKLLEKPTLYQFLLHNLIIPVQCKFNTADQGRQWTYNV